MRCSIKQLRHQIAPASALLGMLARLKLVNGCMLHGMHSQARCHPQQVNVHRQRSPSAQPIDFVSQNRSTGSVLLSVPFVCRAKGTRCGGCTLRRHCRKPDASTARPIRTTSRRHTLASDMAWGLGERWQRSLHQLNAALKRTLAAAGQITGFLLGAAVARCEVAH